jgi:Methyltransferase domain
LLRPLRPQRPGSPMADGVEVSESAASPLAVLGPGPLTSYWQFRRAVARAQLAEWLPPTRQLLVDISGPDSTSSAQAAACGHTVIRVIPPRQAAAHDPARQRQRRGVVVPVVAERASLAFLAAGCVDAVIAEEGALSRQLMAEDLAAEIARVLRPGGHLLASVDSLVLGMAILAEQRCWAGLTDLPHAEVVLIPWPDGTFTRCFGVSQFRDLLTEAGLEVRWIRPRTVLSPPLVEHVLRSNPAAIERLVRAELAAGQDQPANSPPAAPRRGRDEEGGMFPAESFGISLLAAARKPARSR